MLGRLELVRRRWTRHVHTKPQSYEELKADFGHWARKEAALIGLFLATGVSVVAAYAYRDDAPVKQIVHCINAATVAAENGDTLEARQLTMRAYAIAKSVSPQERHLHELAFAIGAQYEAAGQHSLAKKCYLEALEHVPHIKNAAEKAELVRMITLDRVAQCCHNASDVRGAIEFYEKALQLHIQFKIDTCTPMDTEGCGIWFNYARLCLDAGNAVKAMELLRAAKNIAKKCNLPEDKVALIDEQLQVATHSIKPIALDPNENI